MNLEVGSKLFTDAPEDLSLSPALTCPATQAPVKGWLKRQVCIFNKLGAMTTLRAYCSLLVVLGLWGPS